MGAGFFDIVILGAIVYAVARVLSGAAGKRPGTTAGPARGDSAPASGAARSPSLRERWRQAVEAAAEAERQAGSREVSRAAGRASVEPDGGEEAEWRWRRPELDRLRVAAAGRADRDAAALATSEAEYVVQTRIPGSRSFARGEAGMQSPGARGPEQALADQDAPDPGREHTESRTGLRPEPAGRRAGLVDLSRFSRVQRAILFPEIVGPPRAYRPLEAPGDQIR